MQPQPEKHLTRYTYTKTSFQGWRVCICRRGKRFTRYISDKVFGGEEGSFAEARRLRDCILADLQASPHEIEAIFARYSTALPPR